VQHYSLLVTVVFQVAARWRFLSPCTTTLTCLSHIQVMLSIQPVVDGLAICGSNTDRYDIIRANVLAYMPLFVTSQEPLNMACAQTYVCLSKVLRAATSRLRKLTQCMHGRCWRFASSFFCYTVTVFTETVTVRLICIPVPCTAYW